jgi:hypothetical protein
MSKQEAGNFYPDTPQEVPLKTWEAAVIYAGLGAATVISLGAAAFAAGWIIQKLFN